MFVSRSCISCSERQLRTSASKVADRLSTRSLIKLQSKCPQIRMMDELKPFFLALCSSNIDFCHPNPMNWWVLTVVSTQLVHNAIASAKIPGWMSFHRLLVSESHAYISPAVVCLALRPSWKYLPVPLPFPWTGLCAS